MEVASTYMDLMKKTEKVKRHYNGIELFPSEIHTLVFIHDHRDSNMTEIAKRQGVTKGALFKIIEKLEKKELLKRYKKVENNKNTYFELTEKGLRAYRGHESFHQDFFDPPSEEFTSFVKENKERVMEVLGYANDYLSHHIEKVDEDLEKGGQKNDEDDCR